jgi:ABC-type cobalamin/Fe3+-siderophores transport system ATPase subunit
VVRYGEPEVRMVTVVDVPVLRLEGVWKAFARGRERVSVLEGVSLDVAVGEIAAVVGMRGQGKTTLVRVASGTLPVDRGRVLLDGRELTGLSEGQLSKVLARDVGLATREGEDRLDVHDYVEMSLSATREYGKQERRHRVEDVLWQLDLTGCASARWDELSNWQRVLVELAQAIVVRPRLLLIDDVVDGLPFEHKRSAMELIERFAKDMRCGVLMVVSDHATAARAAKVWSLAHGELELMHKDEPGITYLPGRPSQAR